MDVEKIATIVVDSAYRIHRRLGPGLLEGVYEAVLDKVLAGRGLHIERQKAVPLIFDDLYFPEAARLDLLVERRLIVELKSVDKLNAIHHKQLLTYLRLLDLPLGLIINFNSALIRDGIRRVVNNHKHLGAFDP